MSAQHSFEPGESARISETLSDANKAFMRYSPGESNRRQAVHTVYGGAHLFRADSAKKLGAVALRSFEEYGPDAQTLAGAIGIDASDKIYERIVEKLRREAVEDFRLDFEDGYGNRPDDEEDGHAASVAAEVARGLEAGSLPPFIGIRIK